MRVVHIYKDVYPPVSGGIEKHIDVLRTTVPDATSDVLVCARGRRTTIERVGNGVEIRVGQLGRVLSSPLAPTFPRWLRRLEADVFHVHMPNPLGELSALTALHGRPYVITYHADIVRQAWLMPVYRPLVEACLDRARRIIVGTEALRRNSPFLACRENVEVVPFAIDTDRYSPDAVTAHARDAVRQRYGTPLVVAVGRLVYYKGFEHLIAAAPRLDASIVIVGTGPLEPRLRQMAEGHTRVHLTGEVSESELPAILSAADCFVLPSVNRAESFGIATLEAQAMGVPAVVTDVGTGTVEAIEPGRTGLVVAPGDPAALIDGIEAIINDPRRRTAMAEAARARVLRRHSVRAQAATLRTLYAAAVADEDAATAARGLWRAHASEKRHRP